jgi:anti-anti-sigma factor
MKLQLISIEKDGYCRLACDGSVTVADFSVDAPDPFETLLGANWASNRIVLDFSRVTYIDSSAIGWLIGAQKKVREAGGRLLVHSAQAGVRQMFELLQLQSILRLVDSEAEAVRNVLGENP